MVLTNMALTNCSQFGIDFQSCFSQKKLALIQKEQKNISYAQRRRALMRFSHATEFWQNMNSQWSSQIDRGTKKKKSLECTLYLSIIWKKKSVSAKYTFCTVKIKLRMISNFQTMKAAMKSYNSRASYSYFCALIYLFKNFKFFSRDEMVYF